MAPSGLQLAGAGLAALALALAYRLSVRGHTRQLERDLAAERRLREQAQANRTAERTGRIAAEKKLKAALLGSAGTATEDAGEVWQFRPIGHIESVFRTRHGTPRQGVVVPLARARLKLLRTSIEPHGALQGLEGYSHVWLLYVFHQNTNAAATVKAKVTPPRLGSKVGVFSTRSPHRPNAIGLTLARLDRIDGDTLWLGGVDLLHMTPVLDVKPYIGQWDSVAPADARCPDWVLDPPVQPFDTVHFSSEAEEGLLDVAGHSVLYGDCGPDTLRALVADVLRHDVRSGHQRECGAVGQVYSVYLDVLHVSWAVDGRTVTVLDVALADASQP